MEAALDLSAARSSCTVSSSASVRVKTELVDIRTNRAETSSVSPASSNQSPTSSTMAGNSILPAQFYRSQSLFPAIPTSIFDNPAFALASALSTRGFLSPALAPSYAPFLNTTLASSPSTGTSPTVGTTITPPASASGGNNFFKTDPISPAEPISLLPSASLALSSLHRRRRPGAYQRHKTEPKSNQIQDQQQESGDQSGPDSGEQPSPAKKGKSTGIVPEEKKDETYWERRRKNNEAAKRSRDARRAKEEEIIVRAAYLEQENLKLKAQVAVLKNETAKLHYMLLNHMQSPSSG